MTDTDARYERRRAIWRMLSTICIAFLLGGVFACSAGEAGATRTSGDEPPIRVKNGTFDLWLLATKDGWHRDGNSQNWKLPGTRKKDTLDLLLTIGSGTPCNVLDGSGDKLDVHYTDGTTVHFQSTGNHTKMTASADFTVDQTTIQWLSYKAAQNDDKAFIDTITLTNNNNSVIACSFSSKEQLHSLVILDF